MLLANKSYPIGARVTAAYNLLMRLGDASFETRRVIRKALMDVRTFQHRGNGSPECRAAWRYYFATQDLRSYTRGAWSR